MNKGKIREYYYAARVVLVAQVVLQIKWGKKALPYQAIECVLKLGVNEASSALTRISINTVSWPGWGIEKDSGLHGTYLTVFPMLCNVII